MLDFHLEKATRIFERGQFDGEKIYLDYDKIEFPVIVRSRRSGDRIELEGVGHKKLKDLFIDHKVEVEIRNRVPVLECGGVVVAVLCSYYGKNNRVAKTIRVTKQSEHVLVGEMRDWKR
jgi:tRNA(Ile)-lysidine synthetase-like protein